MYSNMQGADGDRLYFDGSALIIVNGEVVAQGSQFSLMDVEVITAVVDLDEVRAFRTSPSHGLQSRNTPDYERIETPFSLSSSQKKMNPMLAPSPKFEARYHSPAEEIALSTGCWLWDYLRRSGAAGYLVPLSGGIDSCATSVAVFSMCRLVLVALEKGNQQVIDDVRRICKYSQGLPKTPQEMCNQLFHSVYMGMKKQSSKETRQRAKDLSEAIGSYHVNLDIDNIFEAQRDLIVKHLEYEPKFKTQGTDFFQTKYTIEYDWRLLTHDPGGTPTESLCLQNIQARSRMVTVCSTPNYAACSFD